MHLPDIVKYISSADIGYCWTRESRQTDEKKKVLAAIVNLSKYRHEHEKFYAEFPLQQAAEIQRASQILKALADRWSGAEVRGPKPGPKPPMRIPFAEKGNLALKEGELEEIAQLKHEMNALAESYGRTGMLLAAGDESAMAAIRPIVGKTPSKAVVGDRHKIIVNDWRAAYDSSKVSRLIRRALDILDRIDFTPASAKAELRGPRFSPKYLLSASELLDKAAEVAKESTGLVRENEQRWMAFRQRVGEVARKSGGRDAKGGTNGDAQADR